MGCERKKKNFSKQGLLIFKDRITQGLFMLSAAETSFWGGVCGSVGKLEQYICAGTTILKPAE